MATITNTALNSRTMGGVIQISDGAGTTIENGNIETGDINSDSLTTNTITTASLTCDGIFRSNIDGPYTIPTSISSLTGSLISYGNTSNSGATDFTNFQASYTSTQGGFRFWNKSNTQTLTNLAIIDNSQTYFSSPLTGCLAENPVSNNSVANKTYIDSNFMFKTGNVQESINGFKTFTNRVDFNGGTAIIVGSGTTLFNGVVTFGSTLTTSNLTANVVTGTQDIFTNNTSGTINIGTGQTTGNLNLGTTSSFTNINSSLLLRTKKKINEMQNISSDTPVTLGFPLPETTIIRTFTVNSLTITLPQVTANERGMLFNFFKFQNNLAVTFTSASRIFTLNDLFTGPTTNTSLLSVDKLMTTLMCGFVGTLNYWVEVSNYSTFDRDYNNTIYPRLSIGNAFTNTNTFNAQVTFNNTTPICSVATPTANDQLVRKDYCDTSFMFKSGAVAESIGGVKTFTNKVIFNSNTEFTGTNGYFTINCNMGSGTLNPASQNGTIGIVGLKDQINDKVLLTLYSNTTHASVKLNFTEGVSIGFGGSSQIANTSVTCDGTNVIIKPNIKFSGDNTIQSSAFTGAGSLSGTYNLSNIIIDSNGKITSLSSGLTTTNSFSGVNTFSNNTNFSSSITFTDIGNFSTIQQNSATLNIENPSIGSTIRLKTRPSTGAVQNSLILNTTSCDILSPTLNLTGTSPISILSPNNLNGTINLFNNLTTGGTLNIGSSAGVNVISGQTTINNKLIVGVNGNTGLNLEVLQQLYLYSVGSPYTDYGRILNVGSGITRYHSYSPIQGYSSKHDFYSSLTGADDATKVVSFETGAALTKVYNTFEVEGVSTFNDSIICNNGATFNSVIPTTSISATSGDELVNYTTLTSQGFTTSSSILSANNNFTGFNTFSSGLTVRSTLLLKDTANVLQSSIDLISGGLLTISCSVNSGKVILSTHDSVGNSYNRLSVDENEVNITAPLTLFVDYTYYNPSLFTSTRLGFSKSNTGSSNTLTNNNVNNSGRINIDAGSWNISYTATLTVISATLTTLKSLEVYVGDVTLNDLNIIGLNVLNYYNTSSVPIGQKIKISGSGNYISYTNVSTELNLLILPLFTAGLAGLTFQGKISATRNA